MRALVILLTFAAAALLAREARADEDLQLSWQAPVGCPSAEQVRDAALRTASHAARREPLEADVRVEHGERWAVIIRTRRAGVPAAERRLEATSCSALADATAVILALALIPEAPGPAPAAAPAPVSVPEADRAHAPEADRTHVDTVSAHSVAASASLATDANTLPAPALGGRAALAWTPGPARIELSGGYFSDQSKTTATSPAGATFALLVAGGRGCWAVARGAVELSPCLGAEVAMVKARGFGAANNYDASAAWLAAAGGALLRVPVASWLALRADADAVVPLSRPTFVVEGDGAVHRPASLGVRAAIGAELLFL